MYALRFVVLLSLQNNVLLPAVAAWETNYYEVSKILSIAAVGYLAVNFCMHTKAWQQKTEKRQKVDALVRATRNKDRKAVLALLYNGSDSNKALQEMRLKSKGKIPQSLAPTHSFRVQLEREKQAIADLEMAQELVKATSLAPLGKCTVRLPCDPRAHIAGYLTVQEALVFKQAYKKT